MKLTVVGMQSTCAVIAPVDSCADLRRLTEHHGWHASSVDTGSGRRTVEQQFFRPVRGSKGVTMLPAFARLSETSSTHTFPMSELGKTVSDYVWGETVRKYVIVKLITLRLRRHMEDRNFGERSRRQGVQPGGGHDSRIFTLLSSMDIHNS